MRALSRHFLASYLNSFATAFAASLVIVSIVEVLLHIDDLISGDRGVSDLASYIFLRLPSYYFRDLVPFCSFAAALLCVGLAARSREITAAKAGGIAPWRIGAPILAAATALSALTFLLQETLVVEAAREFQRRESSGSEIAFRQGAFWIRRDDAIYNVEEADPADGQLYGVRILEIDPRGRLRRSLHAPRADLDDAGRWRLRDAVIRTFDPEEPDAAPRLERRDATVPAVSLRDAAAFLAAGTETLSLPELGELARARAAAGRDASGLRSLWHERVAQPWSVLAFALVAIPLGFAAESRRELLGSAALGAGVLAAFYGLRAVLAVLAARGVPGAAEGPWLALAALFAAGLVRLFRGQR